MMKIIYFSQKKQFLTEMETLKGPKEYVTPSPAKADGLRTRLLTHNSQDVITIAKFTSNLVQCLWGDEEKPQVKRKSELLLIFGILKNKYLPDLGYEQFTQAYNLFSDLRSFTLNQDALTSVLDEQPEVIKDAVKLFWQLLELTGYLDEHGAYQKISEKLRTQEEMETLKKTYVFWGFQHLNGQQIDLLNALAIRYDVIIPFPLALKKHLKRSDWITWLKDSKIIEVDLAVEESHAKAKWIPINSREISLYLKDYIKKHDQVILGVSKLSALHIDIVPSQELRFKIPHQLINAELKEVAQSFKNFSGPTNDLKNVLINEFKTAKSLKHLKAYQLYLEALESITELTDNVFSVDAFFLKLLFEVVSLNQPRTSYVPVSSYEMTMDLKDMSSLEDLDRNRRVILCVDERFEDIQGLGQNYTETIQKALLVLGPLKRNELELLFKQWEFRDLFSNADITVLMGEGTLKHSLIWKRLFSDIELIPGDKMGVVHGRILKDHFKELSKKAFESTFSASKIQTFMDCRRKFYFNYVDKVFPNIVLEKDFDPMTSGTIIHKIIEEFFKRNLNDDELKELTREIMQVYIKNGDLDLPREIYLQREMIFNHRSLNGIQFIRQLENKSGEKINWMIEQSFKLEENFTINGRIDCLGVGEKYIFLLDFKSTAGAASSSSEVASYDSIQLWAYAQAAKKLVKDFEKKIIILGYVTLEDPSESSLLTDDEDFYRINKEARLCKVHKFKDAFTQKLEESQKVMADIGAAILAEKEFPANPREKETCRFCELNKVCVKSEIIHV